MSQIYAGAFCGHSEITGIQLPEGLVCIGDGSQSIEPIGAEGAFTGTSLTSIKIPDSVTCIGRGAFSGCSKLKSVTLEVYKGTAGLKYAKQFYKEYYQPYEVLEKPKALSKAKVSSISDQTYTGKNIKPAVTITGKGSYAGTVTKTFTICPKSTSITKAAAKSKGFEIKWKKQSSQTTGYQIQYSTSSKFTAKTTETLTVGKNKTVFRPGSSLKGNKKYYVRIRTYKTVTVSGKSQKIYSGWSKAKTVRTKK